MLKNMNLQWKPTWFLNGLLLGCLVFYIMPMWYQTSTGNAQLRMEINEKLLMIGNGQKQMIAKLEMQVAFYEHILALDTETCKENYINARKAYKIMVGEPTEEDE